MAGFNRAVIDDPGGFLNGGQNTLRATAVIQFILHCLAVGLLRTCLVFFHLHGPSERPGQLQADAVPEVVGNGTRVVALYGVGHGR